MLKELLDNIRKATPLVHNITNYVTVNDCANVVLACGASPVMADEPSEAAEIAAISQALVINIGTLNENTVKAMVTAGKKANELSVPVVLDPVGVGASKLRTNTARNLMREINFSVIRGNISEIKCLAQGTATTKGVDADENDAVDSENLDGAVGFAKKLSAETGAVIVITGAIDIAATADSAYIIKNGHPMMSRITGTGCMLTSLIGCFCGANSGDCFGAATAAVCAMGLCGELAHDKTVRDNGGTSSFRAHLIDAISRLDGDTLEGGAKFESR